MKLGKVSSRTKQIAVVLTVVVLLSATLPAYAQYKVERTDFPAKKQLMKLGRGLANVFSGWAEIPKEIYERSKDSETLGAIVFTAPVVGFAKAAGRTAVGFFEVVTFFLPIPEDYGPLVEPEFVY